MDRLSIEKILSLIYLFISLVGGITSITTGIAWGHWYKTLDQCINRNCSCILYGQHTPSVFLGGEQAPCIWTVFGPLFYVLFTVALTCFHGYRVLFTIKSPKTRSSRAMLARMEPDGSNVQIQTITQEMTSLLPSGYWLTMAIFSGIFTVYSLFHFGIYFKGYYTTCNQYRITLERTLALHGSALPVLYSRLACTSIFDFMDYMQLDTGNAYRNGIINTGLTLTLGSTASGISCGLFLAATIFNVLLYRMNEND